MLGLLGIGDNASSGVDVGDIGHSLRCRRASTTYMQRQNGGSDGDRKKWTLSFWLKPSRIETAAGATDGMHLFMVGNTNPNGGGGPATYSRLILGTANNALCWTSASSSGEAFQTNNLLRDVAGPVHILVVADHANTSIKCYIGGVEASYSSRTNPTNTDGAVNRASYYNSFGIFHTGEPRALDGYISRLCFVGGSALTPSDFGYLNTEINEWVSKSASAVKAVVDAGGTNSFMLDFDDATSLTTLGNDYSSKNNDWTLTNFSVTAGTTYDNMIDVPGNSSCVGSPINTMLSSAYAEGSLKIGTASAGLAYLHACTQAMTSGKWYFEAINTGYASASGAVGIFKTSASLDAASPGGYANTNWYGYCNNGQKFNGASQTAYGATYNATTPDVIGVAYDADAGSLEFYKNNTSQGVAFTGVTGGAVPCFMAYNGNYFVLCAGQAPLHASATYHSAAGGYFRYAPPTGYKALCQANLATPAILNPEQHHNVYTVTKSGNTNFTLDWNADTYDTYFEIKRRDAAGDWYNVDGLRGYDKILKSNSTAAETTDANVLGVSGTTCTLKSTLPDGTYVISAWKAGLTASRQTNTDGSITSTVSRNVTSGFAIVTATGTAANATVGHGLGSVPKQITSKARASVTEWPVYHGSLANTEYMVLNTTAAKATGATYWNSTTPSSTVFSLGSSTNTNNTGGMVFYVHAEIPGYSKFGSYVGNATTDNAYADIGLKAKWLRTKASSTTDDWRVYDSLRPGYNVQGGTLLANTTALESTTAEVDIDSSGFKVRIATTPGAAQTYTYSAYADVAGKFSLAR